jgi:hypothetical protein
MIRERALKIVLVLVGLLFVALYLSLRKTTYHDGLPFSRDHHVLPTGQAFFLSVCLIS